MRNYDNIAITDGTEFEDYVIKIHSKDNTSSIRNKYYYHSDEGCFWAKNINGIIKYSRDDVFDTEKLDATHIVVFLK